MGMVAAPSESSEAVSFLMAPIPEQAPHCVMTMRGGNQKGLDMCGVECLHALCMLHLSRQLPRRRTESVGEWRKLADMFAGAARGDQHV